MSGYVKSAIVRIWWRRIRIRAFAPTAKPKIPTLHIWSNPWQMLKETKMSKSTLITSIKTKANNSQLQIPLGRGTIGHSSSFNLREAKTILMRGLQVDNRQMSRAIPILLDREGTPGWNHQVSRTRRWARQISIVSNRSMEVGNLNSVTDAWISLQILEMAIRHASNVRRMMPQKNRGRATSQCSKATSHSNRAPSRASQDPTVEQDLSNSISNTIQIEMSKVCKTRIWEAATIATSLLSSSNFPSSPKTKMRTNLRERAISINAWNVRSILYMSKMTSSVKMPNAQAIVRLSTCKNR